MVTLFDYLDPHRTEERRDAQRADAERYRSSKANARPASTPAVATPFRGERHALLASLAPMWATKERPAPETDVLDGGPAAVTPGLPRRPRSVPRPARPAWGDWLLVAFVSAGLLVGVLLVLLDLEI